MSACAPRRCESAASTSRCFSSLMKPSRLLQNVVSVLLLGTCRWSEVHTVGPSQLATLIRLIEDTVGRGVRELHWEVPWDWSRNNVHAGKAFIPSSAEPEEILCASRDYLLHRISTSAEEEKLSCLKTRGTWRSSSQSSFSVNSKLNCGPEPKLK